MRFTIGVISRSNSSRVDLALVASSPWYSRSITADGHNDSSSFAWITARRSSCTASLFAGDVLAPFGLDVFERDPEQQIVDIVAAQVRVAIGGEHFEDAVVQPENRDVERAAAQIVHRDDAFLALIEAVGERGRRRLVHQPQHFQARDPARVLGRLPLRVVEIRRNRDDGLCDRLAQSPLRRSSSACEECARRSRAA